MYAQVVYYCPSCSHDKIQDLTYGYRCLDCGFCWDFYWTHDVNGVKKNERIIG